MAEVVIVTDALGAIGFRLAGIRPIVARDAQEAEARTLDALSTKGRPLFLGINEEWLRSLSSTARAKLEEDPAILPAGIPPLSLGHAAEERDYLAALVRRAIGVELHWE